jgi:hypothetical protein
MAVAMAASCAPADDAASTEDDLSAVRQAQMATRVFRKLVGRDPTPAEIGRLRNASLAEMVDSVLALPDFQRDGFFGFQRDRLLLHRDGDASWQAASLNDYCALKLDMEDVARADANGAGYYEILRYRDRWVPMTRSSINLPGSCLTIKAGELKRAMGMTPSPPIELDGGAPEPDAGTDADADAPPPPPPSFDAQTCAQYLSFRDVPQRARGARSEP